MARLSFNSKRKFIFLFWFVMLTGFPVEPHKNLLSGRGRLSSPVFANSIWESVIPSFFSDFLAPDILDQYEDEIFGNLTSKACKRDVVHIWNMLVGSVMNSSLPEDYILQMMDSWGKLPSGILNGHLSVPGDFDECVNVHGKAYGKAEEEIRGSYCLGIFIPKLGAPVVLPAKDENPTGRIAAGSGQGKNARGAVTPAELLNLMGKSGTSMLMPLIPFVGTCFPSSCSKEDVSMLLANVFRIFTNGTVTPIVISCQQNEKPPMQARHFVMITIVAIICALCVFSTAFDLLVLPNIQTENAAINEPGKGVKALKSFSIYTNTMKLLETSVGGSDNLGCLHGIRFLSMAWVVLGHTWISLNNQFVWNGVDVQEMYKSNWTLMAVLNATLSVDTFFVLSGALVSYGILKELNRTGWLNVPLLYVHRYLRITPAYAIIIGIMATIMPYFGNAPNWYAIEADSKNCQTNWWHNLLYINTLISYDFTKGEGMCYAESWYLANDMIYFILSPLFVYPLWRWKWLGLPFLAAWFLQPVIHTCVLLAENGLTPTIIPIMPLNTYMNDVYTKPWTRSAPYAVGILLGYILHNLKTLSPFPRVPKWSVFLAWIVSTGTAMAIVFGPYRYFDPANFSEIASPLCIIYGTVHRPLWAFVMTWIILACVSGYGGPVNAFLSWKPFVPLGRLCYCIYISSYHLQIIYGVLTYHPADYGIYHMVYVYLGHMTFFILIGFVLTVTIECPFIQLEKLLFEGVRKSGEKSKAILENGSEISMMRPANSNN